MEIYLMQHGESFTKNTDPERSLTPQGEEQIHLSAKALKKLGVKLDLVISSPKKRARQTAQIVAMEIGYPQDSIEVTEALEPTVPAQEFLSYLASQNLKNQVFLAGHLPSLGKIASALLSNASPVSIQFEMGCIVKIDIEKPQSHNGNLRWLLTGDQLSMLCKAN